MGASLTKFLILSSLLTTALPCFSQVVGAYRNPSLPVSDRVEDLLSRMTREEKFWQLFMIPGDLSHQKEKFKNGIFGLQVSTGGSAEAASQIVGSSDQTTPLETARKINAIQKYFVEQTRLGIPILAVDEALHGLVRSGATSFPVPIALAATWDPTLMQSVATAIARETKSRGIRDVLSPVLNIAADPRWGRTEETYGEDPFLASEMGVAFISAFEKMGVVTTPKHFLANSGDGGRDSYPIDYNERLLEEYYLPPFRDAIDRGKSRSIMTSYNSIDGSPGTANAWLLNTKLKQDMKFNGFIISDAGAVGGANVLHFTAAGYEDATVNSMKNGGHVIFQTAFEHHKLFMPPFLDGRINQQIIDSAVARVLRVKFELGLFEHPYVDEREAVLWNGHADHKTLAKQAALKSIVLLKNDNQVLPLNPSIASLAVIGMDAIEARLGGYSRPGQGEVSIFQGIKSKVGSKTNVGFSPGCGRKTIEYISVPASSLSSIVDGKKVEGLQGEYFNNVNLEGKPVLKRVDRELNFRWTLYAPDPSINFDFFSARWTGKLVPAETGKFQIGFEGNDGYRLFIDGKLILDNWKNQTSSTRLVEFSFERGKAYDIRAEFYESTGISNLKLIWNLGVKDNWQEKIDDAVSLASNSDAVVIVAGIDEGEGLDRSHLSLPGHQEEMISRVAATGKPLVVVLVGGSAITMNNWIDKASSILDVWYPGDQGGAAVADVLFGDSNPGGKLPLSFPVFEGQLPYVYNHKPTGRNDDYSDLTGQPLFPFGFGLSYTTFQYSNLKFDKQQIASGESVAVRCTVRNTGKRDGEEVVQLYIRDELSSTAQPVKQLKGFQRISLKTGEEKEITFKITPESLKMLNDKMQWVVEPGSFRIMIGSSSRDIRLRGILTVMAK